MKMIVENSCDGVNFCKVTSLQTANLPKKALSRVFSSELLEI